MLNMEKIFEKSHSYLWSTQRDHLYWQYPAFLGSSFVSQYYLALCHLNALDKSKFDTERLKIELIETQLADGGWKQVLEENIETSNLDATIFNYWFLKSSRSLPSDDKSMKRARELILSRGGLSSCSTMTKVWLCLFGQLDWKELAHIPLFVFKNSNFIERQIYVANFVAQWIYPHVLPIAYLKNYRIQKDLGPEFDLAELCCSPLSVTDYKKQVRSKPSHDVENLVKKIKEVRCPQGTYGCYTVSTYFSLMALQDWYENLSEHHFEDISTFNPLMNKSIEILDNISIDLDSNACLGAVCDGRWWDTLLVILALLDTGASKEELLPSMTHCLRQGLQPCGGMAYGIEFEYCPDTDDTGILVSILAKYFKDEFKEELELANQWLMHMQNHDGGFGAFSKGVIDWWPVKLVAGAFQNSGELFDASSVDVTAHVLEGWGLSGYKLSDKHVRKAIEFIIQKQTDFGAWEGRWGCNYIYSIGAVVSALAQFDDFKVEDKSASWLVKSVNWLLKCQNEDGGFGESTLSYFEHSWAGKGKSTPSQTAWSLMALIEYYNVDVKFKDAVEKGVEYLKANFSATETWKDASGVGTGHRKIVFMQYPVYALTWPLIALSRYSHLKKNNHEEIFF